MLARVISGRRGLVLGVVAALACGGWLVLPAAAPAAGGQSSLTSTSTPLGGGITVPGSSSTTASVSTAASTSTSSGGGGGISTGSAIGIAIAAFVIIIGIAAAILRDARRRTHNRHATRADAAPAERVPGSQRPPKARKLSPAERRRRKRGRAPRRR